MPYLDPSVMRDRVSNLSIFSEAYFEAESPESRRKILERCSRQAVEQLSNQEQEEAIMALPVLGELSAAQASSEVFNEQVSAGAYLTLLEVARHRSRSGAIECGNFGPLT